MVYLVFYASEMTVKMFHQEIIRSVATNHFFEK